MRHVLRARVEAVKALAGFFAQLERADAGKKVKASVHLAALYGVVVKPQEGLEDMDGNPLEPQGLRTSREVVEFLRKRGAKIPTLVGGEIEGEWAALSSEGELSTAEEKEELVWVPPTVDR